MDAFNRAIGAAFRNAHEPHKRGKEINGGIGGINHSPLGPWPDSVKEKVYPPMSYREGPYSRQCSHMYVIRSEHKNCVFHQFVISKSEGFIVIINGPFKVLG